MIFFFFKENGEVVFLPTLPPSSGPCKCLPGKRENRENLLRERRRGGGDATDGERGGVTAEREEGGGRRGKERERETSWFIWFSFQRSGVEITPLCAFILFRCSHFLITGGFSFSCERHKS